MLFAHKAADGFDVVVERLEVGFLNYAHHGGAHGVHLVGDFLAHHRAADDEVGLEGEDFLDVEVADAANGGNLRRLVGVLAEVRATHEDVVGAEGIDNLGDGRGEAYHTLRLRGHHDGAAVVVGDGVVKGSRFLVSAASGEQQSKAEQHNCNP